MTDTKVLLKNWNVATSRLSWGVQKAFRDALTLAAEEKVTLVHGADYRDGSPCLVNSVASMLTTSGGHGIPSQHFGEVVGLFDRLNKVISGNQSGKVTPIAAETLLRYFATEQPKPVETKDEVSDDTQPYVEPKDDDLANDWLNSLQVESAMELDFPQVDAVKVEHGETEGR